MLPIVTRNSWAREAPGEKAKFDAETMTLLRRISDLVPDRLQSWQPFEETDAGITMLMLKGLTDKSGKDATAPLRITVAPAGPDPAPGVR
jgi:hypothetical protein